MSDLPREPLDSYRPPEPSPDLVDRIMKAVDEHAEAAQQTGRGRARRRRRLAVAAAAAAAAILGALLIWRGVDHDEGGGGSWRSIRAGSRRSIALGAYTTAVVHAGASMRWRAGDAGVAVEQERGVVVYTAEKGAALAVGVPGGSVRGGADGAQFKLEVDPMTSRTKRGALGAAALAVAAVAVYQGRVLLANSEGEVALAAGDEGSISPGAPPRRSSGAARARVSAPTRPRARTGWARRFASQRARQELLRIIHAARARRESTKSTKPQPADRAGTSSGQEAPKGRLSKEYIQATIKEAIPLVKECYELSLHEKPDLAGRLVAEFTIVGEEEAGGLVSLVDITGEDSIARHAPLRECIQETIYSLEFPRPEGGGQVKVRYPFTFRRGERRGKAPQ
jgi:hypothetical protein